MANFFAFIKTHKPIVYSLLWILFFSLFTGVYFLNKDWVDTLISNTVLNKKFLVFEVSGGNFDLWIKKIPYNTKSIDISFSKKLDPNSVWKDLFTISPKVPWVVKIEDNTLKYELSDKLEIWKDYTITLSKNITSLEWEKFENDILYIISCVSGAKVVKVLPEQQLEDISKNMVVFFNMPMVPLTNLDIKDTLPCPLEITPKIAWKCSWTTTSVLEFIPEKSFIWATKYEYSIMWKPGMNYPLEQNMTGSFTTPWLKLTISDTFIPKDSIHLSFNYPVSIEELEKKLTLVQFDQFNSKDLTWIQIPFRVEPIEKSENNFLLKTLSWLYTYDTSYRVGMKPWLLPKYGNIPFEDNYFQHTKTTSFIENVDIYRNIYSDTWSLIDTKYMNNSQYIPNKDIFFQITFYEDIELNKDLFVFKNTKTGKNSDFTINYKKDQKEENGKNVSYDNKQNIQLKLNENLENNSSYTLTLLKKANASIVKDIDYTYTTSPEFAITNFKFIDYSKSCLYVNNDLDNLDSWDESYNTTLKNFNFSNSWIVKSVAKWQYYADRKFEQDIKELSFTEANKKLQEAWYCTLANTGEILYAIDTRLNPNIYYTLNIKNLQDIYGNTIKKDFSQTLKTWDLKQIDKYVYLSFANDVNVYPKTVPVMVNIQEINTPQVLVEVCEMDEKNYIYNLSHRYQEKYTPLCSKNTAKIVDTKINYWKLTNNRFDVENEILWNKLTYDYVIITIYSDPNKDNALNRASNIIVRTNTSLFVERAENKSLLYATDLTNNTEIEGLNLEFFTYKWEATTVKYSYDTNKKVYVIDNSLSNISYITAKNENFAGLISSDDDFSNYDFKYISWQDSSTKDYAYIYSDRPIYRPGDEVFIKGLLREFRFDGFKPSQIKFWTLELIDENWSSYRSLDIKVDKNSNFTWSFIIPKDSALWNFRFKFSYKLNEKDSYDTEVYANGWLSIEQYRKPTFKVEIESPKNDILLWESTNIKVAPKYYFWGNMTNTRWIYSILTQNYFFDGKEYGNYQFGIGNDYFDCMYWGYCNYSDHWNSWVKDFQIDENGQFSLDYTFSKEPQDAEKIYTFSFDVTDPDTEKTVSNSVSKVLHTTDAYVWLQAWYYNSKEKWIYMKAVTLDYDAKPLPNKKIKIEVLKQEYKQVKKLWVDGVYYNEYSTEKIVENTLDLTTDDKWELAYNVKTKESGEYELKVSYTWWNGQTFVSSQTVYVAWNDYISWGNDNNTVTDLTSDKITYKLGETAKFILKSPVNNGKALIVVEKDNGIIDYFVHEIKTFWDQIDLKLTDKHYPNVYLKVYLIGNQKDNPLPIFKRALSVVKVLTDYKKLNVSILTDKKNYKPADKMQVTVEVVDANGKVVPNANGTLSIVDESVLALKWNPKKNPYSFFYDMKRYLWVLSAWNLKYLIEKLEVKDVSWGEKWWAWDQVKGWDTKKLRWNFKDTAFWLSDFTTDANGKALIQIPLLPDNLTTWVIEALVSTSLDNKIWVNYETVMTSNPVVIEDNLPRFLATDDTITFSPVIYNKTGKDDDFQVSIQATNGTLITTEKPLSLINWASEKVSFIFTVKKASDFKAFDVSEIIISARSKTNGNMQDAIKKIIPIHVGTIAENTSTVWKTDKISFDEKITLWNVLKDDATLTLNYWGTLLSYLLDGIDYLAQYPYGCAEQRTSAIMPNVYIKKLYDIAWVAFDLKTKMVKKYIDNEVWYKEISVDEAIKDYLMEIKKFQNTDGWFMYWYDTIDKISDIHLTNYILSSLSELKWLWYTVDNGVLKQARDYLKNEFENMPTCSEKIWNDCITVRQKSDILLALNTYDSKDYEVYKMLKTLDISKEENLYQADIISRISNISTLLKSESAPLKKDASTIVWKILSNELVINPRSAFVGAWTYSRVYNTTKLLEVMGNIGLENFTDSEAIIDNMLRFISQSKMNNSFGSTYDNSYIIRALTSYLSKTNELKNTNIFARFHMNSAEIETKKIDKSNIFETFQKTFSLKDIQKSNTFNVSKDGSGSIYYDLSLRYFVPTKDLKARDEGFFIEKTYFSLNEYKKFESLKAQEYEKYLSWEIIYDNLKYPHEVVEYLTPITSGKIWDLVLVYNKLVTSETRDQVALESYIPAGSEIVNTALATETKTVTDVATNMYIDRKELRDEMYFGWVRSLEPWIYNFSYTIRLTHSGDYKIKPTQASEFYTPEVFWRSSGGIFTVE